MEKYLELCPLDSRYSDIKELLSPFFSEYSYVYYRVFVEIKWLIYLINNDLIDGDIEKINTIYENFDLKSFKKVKDEESITNHDVKAIEYFIDKELKKLNMSSLISFVHFGATSEDINNTAYALMIKEFLNKVYYPKIDEFILYLKELSDLYKNTTILAHTHGQPATPTTIGKEFKVYIYRITEEVKKLKNIEIKAKFNGATGNYSAFKVAYPDIDVLNFSKKFIENLDLTFNPLTTQIENHDYIVSITDIIRHINNIIMDLNLDMWLYISYGYFKLRVVSHEVGSSTMPHKVNPINFENSESNLETSNSLLIMLSNKLPKSRMQRDLSDSSTLRNLGIAFGYSIQGIKESLKGLKRVSVNEEKVKQELLDNYEVLGEAIQTVLRKNKQENAYEKLKELTRGKKVTKKEIQEFIKSLDISDDDKKVLLELEPSNYIGIANIL
ncbi:MAG: adenylosuccinate lyase [Bacilli bacterium]|nr:adenylosuccinate lyase [Bacilli bacterium]